MTTQHTEKTWTPQHTEKTWRQKLTLAAVTGLLSGAAKAIIAWTLDHLTST
ncbi:MAG TPA: hypothetical protein VFC19_18230 [Candidatus Limnocylindrales bacterium]|nr:hypothetical protein [Candidatus Limnocylindrales bacterium]